MTEATTEQVEHIFIAWDEALGARDVDAAVALYRPDATLESPLVCHLLGSEDGVVRAVAPPQIVVTDSDRHLDPTSLAGRVRCRSPNLAPNARHIDMRQAVSHSFFRGSKKRA